MYFIPYMDPMRIHLHSTFSKNNLYTPPKLDKIWKLNIHVPSGFFVGNPKVHFFKPPFFQDVIRQVSGENYSPRKNLPKQSDRSSEIHRVEWLNLCRHWNPGISSTSGECWKLTERGIHSSQTKWIFIGIPLPMFFVDSLCSKQKV